MATHTKRCFEFKGVRIDDVNLADIKMKIMTNPTGRGYMCFNDVTNISRAINDPGMFQAVNGSLVSASDGMPLVWFGKLVGSERIERVAGFDCLTHLLEEDNGLRHFLLGDTEATIERVISKAKSRNRDIKIHGYSPPFKDKFDSKDNAIIINKINHFNPDVVWVSFGGGKQEIWMNDNYQKINRGVMMGVGAAFKFYIGELKIPPLIIQKMGMQWFFRMLSAPKVWFRTQASAKLIFLLYLPIEVLKGRSMCRIK